MRVAEAVGLELVDVDIQRPRLLGIADENGPVGGDLVGRVAPHELVGRLVDDGCRVEFDRLGRSGEAQGRDGDGKLDTSDKLKTWPGEAIGHIHLPWSGS